MKKILVAVTMFITSACFAQSNTLTSAVYNLDSIRTHNPASKGYLQGSTTDLASLKVHTSTLEAGKVNHPPRALNDYDELIVIKDGQLKVNVNDSSKILGPGSIALIIAGDTQNFQNVSDKPVTYCVLSFKSTAPVDINRGKKGGGSFMKDFNELTVKKTDKGESRPVFDRPSPMFERFEVHATALNPGFESHPQHRHRSEEIMLLMKGNVTMHIADAYQKATAGDVILVRPNIAHNLKNTGNEQCWYYAIRWYNSLSDK
jgi:(S)-ureidoglycine aminohydrolase